MRPHLGRLPRGFFARLSALFCGVVLLAAALAAPNALAASDTAARRHFNVPRGDAEKSLKLFSQQSGRGVIFSTDALRNIQTNAVEGEFTAREALNRMVDGTGLEIGVEQKTGAFAIRKGVADPNAPRVAPAVTRSAHPEKTSKNALGSDDEEKVVMSPFEVIADGDVGYVATNSLAGTRLNTNLRDISSQIFVLTPELLSDLAVNGIEDSMIYMANFETIRDFAEANVLSAGTQSLETNTRVRGLEGTTNLVGMFPTYSAADSFNSERFTLASGPNAIMFGLGNAGGIIDTTPKRATFRSRTDVRFRTDNFDGSRAEVDANIPMIPKLLAARFAGLVDNKGHFRRPYRDDNRRFYSALTVQPFAATTVHANAEWYHRDAQRTPLQLPRDYASGWIDAGRIPFDNSGTTPVSAALISSRAGANAYLFGANNNASPVYVYGNSPALAVQSFAGTVTSIQRSNWAPLAFDRLAYAFDRPDLYPREVSPMGLTAPNRISGRVVQAAVDQTLAQDLHLNLGYSHETYFEKVGGYSSYPTVDSGLTMKVDPNRFLPDRVTPNPNFGKLYIEDLGSLTLKDFRQDAARASLSYELDLTRRPDALRWLGRYRALATWSWQLNDHRTHPHQAMVGDGPNGPPPFVTGAATTNYRAPQRVFRMRYYLDTLADPASQGRYYKLPPGGGDPQETATITDPVSGRSFPVYLSENPQGAYFRPTGTKREIVSTIVAVQNYLLRDRLVLTAGAREDGARTAMLDPSSTAAQPNGLFPHWAMSRYAGFGSYSRRRSHSWGAVGHVRPWLSLHYNQSANNNPLTSLLDPFGQPVEGKSGVGSDYGLTLTFMGGKVVARANWFVNSQVSAPALTGLLGSGENLRDVAYNIEQRIRRDINPGLAAAGLDPLLYTVSNYAVVSAYESKGVEYQVIASPTHNWRVFATAGLQRTYQSRSAEAWLRWVEQRLPVWSQAGRGWDIETLSDSTPQTLRDYYESSFVAQNLLPLLSASARKRNQQRDWRVNLNTNYTFEQGRFRGVVIGGGFRYRSPAAIGYGVKSVSKGTVIAGYNNDKPVADNTVLMDPEREYTSPATFLVDTMVAYELPGSRRDRQYRVQLNVRNLLDRDELVPSFADSNGVVRNWSFQYPREFILSFNASF